MSHEVFVSYDVKDKRACDAVYNALEENGLECWVYSRDFSAGDSVDKISDAIERSKIMVVIYSRDSRISNHVATEVDIAYMKRLPIIIFNVDGSTKKGNLEFFTEDVLWMPAGPDNYTQVRELIRKASRRLDMPIENPIVDPKINLMPASRLKKFLMVAVPVAIVLVLVYLFVIMPMGQHADDSGIFSMEISGVDVRHVNGKYYYTIFGDAYNMPENPGECIVQTTCLDSNDDEVYSGSTTLDEFSSGIICGFGLDDDNVTEIDIRVVDLYDNELCRDSFEVT